MSSSPHEEERDYTDGASAQEIQTAIREVPRGRGDQQIAGSYQPMRSMSFRDADDAGGAIFDGPGSVTIPSRVTGLRSTRSRSFRAGSRREGRVFNANGQNTELDSARPVLRRRGTGRSDTADTLADSDVDDVSLAETIPISSGPPSQQDLYIADEDLKLRLLGYQTVFWRSLLWSFLSSVPLVGILALPGHWLPELWLRCVARKTSFGAKSADLVIVENPSKDIIICQATTVPYPYSYMGTFQTNGGATPVPSSTSGTRPSSAIKLSAIAPRNGVEDDEILKQLKLFDYRYNRYILNPRTGLWTMVKDWRDQSSTTLYEAQKGLGMKDRFQRQILFGPNLVDIKGKSVINLLVEEVLHPFYVFQIATIVLWSIDDYYYYAFCIAIISTFSILTTLIETRKNISRMREMARFVCPVKLTTKEATSIVDSSELVPGDVVNLSNPALAIFPCDILLLVGDAIVNESMLTGESVPISKGAIKSEYLTRWTQTGEVTPDIARGMLYSGTKAVRIRGPAQGSIDSPAMGYVVRTGFNTTKGALVRSMLFPKPTGFKFYRDSRSMRFIAVLAGIAVMGFMIVMPRMSRFLCILWALVLAFCSSSYADLVSSPLFLWPHSVLLPAPV